MLVVHALWSPGRGLLIWGEDGELPVTSPSQALRSARPHPFAAAATTLAGVHPGEPTTVTLLLPSLKMSPLDSPELIRMAPRPRPQRPPALLPWAVPALVIDPAELLRPAPEVRYGATVEHLRALAAFGEDLVARGRVLPALTMNGGTAWSRWRPVATGPDAVALHALILGLPPVGRCEQCGPGDTAGASPEVLVADALSTLVDLSARTVLTGNSVDALPPRRGRRPRVLPAAEAWLTALAGPGGGGVEITDDVEELGRALAEWDHVGAEVTGPARVLFRLTEPLGDPLRPLGDEEPPWRLEFHLQSTSDPSLQVGAGQVWSAPGTLQRWIDRPQEVLLAELGRASTVYPALTASLRTAAPSGWNLDLDDAFAFLSEGATLLDAAGFAVQLPGWWDRRNRLGLVASASSTPADAAVVDGGMNREVLANFRWSLAVGGDELTEEEIAELVAAKAPLVRLRGRWIAIDPDRLRRGLDFLRRPRPEPPTAAELLALAGGHPDDSDLPLPLVDIRVEGWVGDLLAGSLDASLAPVPTPPAFTATLRPYQQRGLSWLAFLARLGLGACLADDMGLGKTVQLLAVEAVDREHEIHRPTLLLCPMSLVGNWQREAARFAPQLRIYAHHGSDRHRGAELAQKLAEVDVVVTTYGTALRDVDELAQHRWRRLVLDEAQAVKNSQAAASRAVRRLPADSRIALTGTPMENRLSELWALMDVLNPGLLGSADRFRTRFAVPVERHGDPDAAELLRRITRPYLLRRVKTDPTIIDDLPAKIEIVQDYRLTPEQASLYQTVVDDMMARIAESDGIERRGNVLAAMAKLKQVCNHPAQLLHDGSPIGRRSGKVTRLEEILTEILAEGDKVLCFTQFAEFGHLLVPHLAARFDTEVLFLHGGVSRARREEMVARFQAPGGPSIFLLSLKAGGTGLNLTAANHVVHLDRWWNPAVENQATDRAFRIGQKRTVQVRKFLCAGTLEERIDEMIQKKTALAQLVVGDGEGWLTELSTGELRALFALSAEAVGE